MRLVLLILLLAIPMSADDFDAPPQYDKWGCVVIQDKVSSRYHVRVKAGFKNVDGYEWKPNGVYGMYEDVEAASCSCGKWNKRQAKLYRERNKK